MYSRLHRTASRQVLSISREGDSTTSLGSLFQCSVTLRGKKFFLKEQLSDMHYWFSNSEFFYLKFRTFSGQFSILGEIPNLQIAVTLHKA